MTGDEDEYTVVSVWDWSPATRGYLASRSVEEQFREFWGTSHVGETWTLLDANGDVVAQYPTDLADADEDADPMRVIVVESPGDVGAWCPGCGDPADPVYAAVDVYAYCETAECPVSEFDPGHAYYDNDADEAGDADGN